MRIVYLHQYFLTAEMAGGTRSFEMARRLVQAGHEVHMVTSDQRPAADAPAWRQSVERGIVVHWARVPYRNEMGFLRRVVAFLHFAAVATIRSARLPMDVIYATSTPLTIAIPALLVSAWRRVPFVFEVRDMWPDVPIAMGILRNPLLIWLARRLELAAYRRAARVVALGPGMRDDIVARGIPAAKVAVIPNGCDLDVFARPGPGPSPRKGHAWLGDRKLVLYAGAIGLVNGVDYLVHVARHVARRDPEIRFVVIGEGKLKESVRALAAREGVLDKSFFMFDAVPKRELAPWLHDADLILALISGPPALWKDAVQNKFFDALAAGKPILSNFEGWQSRLAVEAGVGATLDSFNTETAAAQLLDALRRFGSTNGLSARAKVLAEGRFNRERLAGELNDLLLSVTGPEPRIST